MDFIIYNIGFVKKKLPVVTYILYYNYEIMQCLGLDIFNLQVDRYSYCKWLKTARFFKFVL